MIIYLNNVQRCIRVENIMGFMRNALYKTIGEPKCDRDVCERKSFDDFKTDRHSVPVFSVVRAVRSNLPLSFPTIDRVSLGFFAHDKIGFRSGSARTKRNFKPSTKRAPDNGYKLVFTKISIQGKSPSH